MTQLERLERLDKDCLTPAEIAPCFGVDPQYLRLQIWNDQRKHKNSFEFPVCVVRKRIKIPRIPFLKFMKGEK